jgi:hypothetical protein
MDVWIDNTGLHGAGRCLAGEARLSQDVRGLLQLATLLVFSETFRFGDYEIPAVTAASSRHTRALIKLGLSETAIAAHHLSQEQYESACRAAASLAADEWSQHFTRSMHEGFTASFDVPTGVKTAQNWLPKAVETGWKTLDREAVRDRRAAGAVEYMLVVNTELRAALSATVTPSWGLREGYLFESFVRAILNDQLAREADSVYVPAAARAEQLARESELVTSEIARDLCDLTAQWRPEFPSLPRLSLALLRRSRGEPHAIILEALALREKARWVRTLLAAKVSAARSGDYNHDITKDELSTYARAALGLEDPPSFLSAIDIQFVIGLPALGLNAGKLRDWVMYNLWKRRLVVFTDMAHAPAFDRDDDLLLKRLFCHSKGGQA